MSVRDFRNVLRRQRLITQRHSICFQCNLVREQTTLSPSSCPKKYMTCPFRFCTILAFLKMAFCRLHEEYWAVNLKSLGVDTLSNTETSKSVLFKCMAQLSINSIFYFHKSLNGPPFWTGAMGRIPVTLRGLKGQQISKSVNLLYCL